MTVTLDTCTELREALRKEAGLLLDGIAIRKHLYILTILYAVQRQLKWTWRLPSWERTTCDIHVR